MRVCCMFVCVYVWAKRERERDRERKRERRWRKKLCSFKNIIVSHFLYDYIQSYARFKMVCFSTLNIRLFRGNNYCYLGFIWRRKSIEYYTFIWWTHFLLWVVFKCVYIQSYARLEMVIFPLQYLANQGQ